MLPLRTAAIWSCLSVVSSSLRPFSLFLHRHPCFLLSLLRNTIRNMAASLFRNLAISTNLSINVRTFSGIVNTEVLTSHTAKWMQDSSKKSPMELIAEVPPIKVEGRIVACEGDSDPALGHPVEFICLDLDSPATCKYCGLRYVQDHHH